jgi:hypothetical protein
MSNWGELEARQGGNISLPPIKLVKRARKKPDLSGELLEAMAKRLKTMRSAAGFEAKRIAGIRKFFREEMTPERRKQARANFAKHELKRLAACRVANAERFENPENVRKMADMARDLWRTGRLSKECFKNRKMTPEGLARKSAASKRMQDRRRGFRIPPNLRSRYDFLVNSKRLRAREAGIVLGLVKDTRPKPPNLILPVIVIAKAAQASAVADDAGIGTIANLVSSASGVPLSEITGPRKTHDAMRARLAFCWICRNEIKASYPKIGRFLGGRDHTTIMNAVRVVDAEPNRFKPIITAYGALKGGMSG